MTSTGSKNLYFRSEYRDSTDYDSGAAETGNERSFDSGNGTMRDQSIQQGNGLIRRTTRKSNSTVGKKKINDNKYISPFILSAEKKAQERARLYQEQKRRQRRPEWNDRPVQSGSLFDPSIHKQEIFKIEPRRKTTESINNNKHEQYYEDRQRPHSTSRLDPRNSSIDDGRVRNPGRSGMTIRTQGVSLICIVMLYICIYYAYKYFNIYLYKSNYYTIILHITHSIYRMCHYNNIVYILIVIKKLALALYNQ